MKHTKARHKEQRLNFLRYSEETKLRLFCNQSDDHCCVSVSGAMVQFTKWSNFAIFPCIIEDPQTKQP